MAKVSALLVFLFALALLIDLLFWAGVAVASLVSKDTALAQFALVGFGLSTFLLLAGVAFTMVYFNSPRRKKGD